jgi:RimJ/RimL family protein N-acetyltransferase
MSFIASRLPPETIQTDRLLIRLPLPEDGATVNAAIKETFVQLHTWMDWAEHLPATHETEEHILKASSAFRAHQDFPYFGFLKASGEFVLATGLHPRDSAFRSFEIGYWCRLSHQGHGYTTEAVKALTQVGLQIVKATRIEIRCDPRNESSRRVAERAGYLLEATLLKNKSLPDGTLRDTNVYVVVKSDGPPIE